MKQWREVEPNRLVVVGSTCDRCGEPASPLNDSEPWGEVAVYVVGQGTDRHEADLCANCSAELAEWIDAGEGRGIADPSQLQADIRAHERLTPLADAVAALGFDTADQDERIMAFVRARGGR